MKSGIRKLIFACACLAAVLGMNGSTGAVSTGGFIAIPFDPFPPFAGFGTIEVFSADGGLGSPGATCMLWRSDAGSLYFFNGIDGFREGDRVFVCGQLCLICYVYNICEVPASAILNADAMIVAPPPMMDVRG